MTATKESEATRLQRLTEDLEASKVDIEARLVRKRAVSGRFILARLSTFAVAAVAFFCTVGFADDRWVKYGTLPGIALFIIAVRYHRPVKREIERLERLLALIARKGRRMAEDAVDVPVDAALRDPTLRSSDDAFVLPPAVREDMGLFDGRRHLFGVAAGSCSSRLGRLEIARRLTQTTLAPETIRRRADASRALLEARVIRHRLEQTFAAVADQPEDSAVAFMTDADFEFPDEKKVGLLRLITAVNLVLLTVALALDWAPGMLGLTLLSIVGGRIFRNGLRRTVELRSGFDSLRPTFRAILDVHALVTRSDAPTDDEEFRLARERIVALVDGDPSLRQALSKMGALDLYKAGIPYVMLNWFTFWDVHHLIPLVRFGRERRDVILAAFDALGRLEAACALADLREVSSGWSWPDVLTSEKPTLEVEGVRHPALPSASAVSNSIELSERGSVCVLTGSNMTGKSTFLKACGSALLLAQAGGPVAARAMRWTPLRLLSDVNVTDSLDDGRSYFAVEVGRIGEVVDLAGRTPFLLAILDEMFRGTNTHEKVAASIEVTRWLAECGVLALVATHDHELTTLPQELPHVGIRNYHFTESIENGAMTFDYTLRDGPATSRNALRVLAHEGFPEKLVERAMSRSETHGSRE